MIILDMDGTLLNSSGVILESSKDILKKLKQMGKIIVIATGRCLPHAINYFNEEFADYILSNNGAIWYRLKDKKIIKENNVGIETGIDILKKYSNFISQINLTDTSFHHFEKVIDAINYMNAHNNIVCVSIHLNDFNKCADTAEKLRCEYEELYIQLMQDSFDKYQWIDIFGRKNNKGVNVKSLCEALDIDFNDTICFGDALNDVEMFKNVKISVAMGNALPEVKDVATHITDTYDNDGIAKFLNNYFFGKEE